MSASRLVTIFCDAPSCGEWWDSRIAESARTARQQLRGTGWRLAARGQPGEPLQDFCPTHARATTPIPDQHDHQED